MTEGVVVQKRIEKERTVDLLVINPVYSSLSIWCLLSQETKSRQDKSLRQSIFVGVTDVVM